MTCTVEITQHTLSQRSPAESIGKGQKLIEAARPERAEALSPGQRPGLSCSQTWRPVTIPRAMPWAKSFCPFYYICTWKNKEVKIFISANYC